MRWTVLAAMVPGALLVAGCGNSGGHSLHATLDADKEAGTVTMMCTESSSGTCHGLFVDGTNIARISAAVGTSAGTSGITDDTRFCLDTAEPTDGCKLKPLAQGEQIVRQEKAPKA
jgi:hypothetical protein